MNIESLKQGLKLIQTCDSNREAGRVASWLLDTYGTTKTYRRMIQDATSCRKSHQKLSNLEREPWGKPGGGCPGGHDGQGWEP